MLLRCSTDGRLLRFFDVLPRIAVLERVYIMLRPSHHDAYPSATALRSGCDWDT